jgi:hypothetical protein
MSRDVLSCTHWLRPRNSPITPHWDLTEGAVGQQRETTSLCNLLNKNKQSRPFVFVVGGPGSTLNRNCWINTVSFATLIEERLREGEGRTRIFKLLRSARIDSKEAISPAYAAWRAGTANQFLLGS